MTLEYWLVRFFRRTLRLMLLTLCHGYKSEVSVPQAFMTRIFTSPAWEASHHPDSYPHQGDITVEDYNHHHADSSFHQRPTTESERRDQITNWLMDDDDSKPWPSSHDSHASGGHTQYPHEDPSLVEPTPAYHDWNRLRHNPTTEEISRLPIDVDHFSPHDHMSTHP